MTYASRLRARLTPTHPSNLSWPNTKPTWWVLDRMAEEEFNRKVTGGFDRNRKCQVHNIALPVTGQCDYC